MPEGDGFELPVPGFRSSIFYTAPELGAAKGPGATAGFEDRQRKVYRAPSPFIDLVIPERLLVLAEP
jgi:hypothetical protein